MSASSGSAVERAGRRLRNKVLVALLLSSGVPLFVLIVLILPRLGTGAAQTLVVLTIVSVLAGAWVIWDLGRIVARIGAVMGSEAAISGFERRRDEVGTLMTSFNRLLVTTEQQAAEINTFATRLDAAYKEMESTNARLKETAFKDDMAPSLYNRRFLLLRLEEEVGRWHQSRRPCSLVLLEPEGLRLVADTVGHAAYDEAIRAFAQILTTPARSATSVIARYDGGRFAALLADTHREGADQYVRAVKAAVASQLPNAHELALRVGVASLPEDSSDAFELMSAADIALRHSLPAD
jgi:diguanylate cyclase (GGDEF)-like protein